MEWSPIILSLELAVITTVILFIVGIPLAHWLAFGNSRIKTVIEVLVALPLVLPPTVIGFYLLISLGPTSSIGTFMYNTFGLRLVFSFTGLVIGSIVYSLPFMVQPLLSGFKQLPDNYRETSWILGKSSWMTLRKVLLPAIKPAVITAGVLTFAHTMGEFGVVLMIGGNLPGRTKTASIALYEEVELLNYSSAHRYALILIVIALALLLTTTIFNRKSLSSRP